MTLRFLTLLLGLTWGTTWGTTWATAAQAETLQVVTSLKPVHSLTSAIMGEVGSPTLLITGGASPHTFSLKPSHASALSRADLVVWIGPELERFLKAPLQNLAADALSLSLAQAEGILSLPARAGGVWGDQHTLDLHSEHMGAKDTHDDHEEGTVDPHIWLDIANAIAMTRAIETALKETYPDHAAVFTENATALRSNLTMLDEEISAATAPVTNTPYFVFHDAYQYFENRYRLSPLGAVTASPDIRPGARRMSDLREAGDKQEHICVFAEPQFEPGLLQVLTERGGATLAYLDPLGSDIEAGPQQYTETLRAMTDNLVNCLNGV